MSNKKNAPADSAYNQPAKDGGGIIYNVTIKVDSAIAAAWLLWLLREHIPDIMKTGCFISSKTVKLLETDDSEGPTYAVQYMVEAKADYNRYMELHAPGMWQKSIDKWGNAFIAFSSVMEVIATDE